MTQETLRYDKMVENALRSVVRDSLAIVASQGLPGGHHFYVTFKTGFPGVQIPDFLRAQYPEEMTIVLEHQFWGLEVDDAQVSVTLSFHSKPQRLIIPLTGITAFADPSVKFGLEFRSETLTEQAEDDVEPESAEVESLQTSKANPVAQDKPAEIVKLDLFRKK